MQKILREHARKYAFDWHDEPLLTVACGETFAVETLDAGSGFFQSPADKAIPANRPGFDRTPPLSNPIAGPILIRGFSLATRSWSRLRRSLSRTIRGRPVDRDVGPLGELGPLERTVWRLHDANHAAPAGAERDDA